MRQTTGWLTCLVLLAMILRAEAAAPQGLELRVAPGAMLIQHVIPGQLYDVDKESGIRLTIPNQSDKPRSYVLSTHLPADIGAQRWLQGYSALPDLSWFWFDQQEITIAAHAVGRVKMYFEIPEKEQYYNQHWVLALGIKGIPGADSTITLAGYPKIQIETASREVAGVSPYGSFGPVPSLLVIKNLPLGMQRQATLRLFNNDVDARQYRLSAKTFPSAPGQLAPIPPTPGYTWIPDPSWVIPGSNRIRVRAQDSAAIALRIEIPMEQKYRGQKWESILFIETEAGRGRFTRIRIETEK